MTDATGLVPTFSKGELQPTGELKVVRTEIVPTPMSYTTIKVTVVDEIGVEWSTNAYVGGSIAGDWELEGQLPLNVRANYVFKSMRWEWHTTEIPANSLTEAWAKLEQEEGGSLDRSSYEFKRLKPYKEKP